MHPGWEAVEATGQAKRKSVDVKTSLKLVGMCVIVCLALAWAASMVRAAAQNESAGQYRIAVVNRKEVFDNYDKQKEEWKTLEAEKAKLQVDIDKLSDSIAADKKKYDDDKSLSEEQRQALEDKIESDYRRYRTEFEQAQREMDSKTRRFFNRMMEEIDRGVQEVGSNENYHLIMEADPKSNTSVLYYSNTINITSKVIAHLNGAK